MKTDREIREKFIIGGPGALTDAELVAVIIREGTENLSAIQLAGRMLANFGGSLSELASSDVSRIRQTAGCGTIRAVSLAAAAEFARRVALEKSLSVDAISSKDDVARLFAPLAELHHEEFWVVYLTLGGRVIDRAKVSQGGVSATVVDHKLVIKRALELLAPSLILVHNHPSGVSSPSPEDFAVTRSVSAAAALFDISVIDHVIISSSGAYSLAENGKL